MLAGMGPCPAVALLRVVSPRLPVAGAVQEKDANLVGEHVREGLTCVVSVKVADPEFEGQTKTRLGNPEVRKTVDAAVADAVAEYLDFHPDTLDAILSKALQAAKVPGPYTTRPPAAPCAAAVVL